MFTKLFLVALAIFLLLTCLLAVTSFQIALGKEICGYSAGVAGVLALVSALQGVNLSATK